MIKTLVFIGGIARESINRKLFAYVEARNGGRFAFDVPALETLPFFSQDIEDAPPAVVVDLRERMERADALLVVTPEYNRSYPAVLKNALDWTSRPKHWGAGKPAAVLGASRGPIGTFGAQLLTRLLLGTLDFHVMTKPEIYFNHAQYVDAQGRLAEASGKIFDDFVDAFAAWATSRRGPTPLGKI